MAITISNLDPVRCESCKSNDNVLTIMVSSFESIHLCAKCRSQLINLLQNTVDDTHSGKWFTIWEQDKKNILSAMHRNLAADLDAGYNYTGQSIQKQLADIDEYKHEFDEQLMSFVGKSNKEIEDWCYWDLKRRGAIE